jgi:hypothetical protein
VNPTDHHQRESPEMEKASSSETLKFLADEMLAVA